MLVTFASNRVDRVMRVDAAGALQWGTAIHGKRFAVGGNRIVASVWQTGGDVITDATLMLEQGQNLAQFDAAPGAVLSLRGRTRALAAPAPDQRRLRALVFAPIGLLESEFANNLLSIPAEASLFADGFEQSASGALR